jgi:hypothetical protein
METLGQLINKKMEADVKQVLEALIMEKKLRTALKQGISKKKILEKMK